MLDQISSADNRTRLHACQVLNDSMCMRSRTIGESSHFHPWLTIKQSDNSHNCESHAAEGRGGGEKEEPACINRSKMSLSSPAFGPSPLCFPVVPLYAVLAAASHFGDSVARLLLGVRRCSIPQRGAPGVLGLVAGASA